MLEEVAALLLRERASDLSAPWGEEEVATLLIKEKEMWAL